VVRRMRYEFSKDEGKEKPNGFWEEIGHPYHILLSIMIHGIGNKRDKILILFFADDLKLIGQINQPCLLWVPLWSARNSVLAPLASPVPKVKQALLSWKQENKYRLKTMCINNLWRVYSPLGSLLGHGYQSQVNVQDREAWKQHLTFGPSYHQHP
jgi:hypothetical protein